MRIDEIIAADGDPVFSFEFFPPKTEEGERNLYEALSALRALEPAFVSVTWGAGGSTREKTIEIVRNIRATHGLEAMAHFTCVGATVDDLRAALDQMREAGIDNVLTLRGDPPRGQTEFVPTEGGLRYATELAQLTAAEYDFCLVGACYPEVHPEAPDAATDLAAPEEEGRGGREGPHHATILRQRGVLPLRRGGARRRHRRADRAGHHADHERGADKALHVDVRRDDTHAAAGGARRRAATTPRRSSTSASPTRRSSAPSCSRAARPGIHFYTLNRSPSTRAILSALRLQRPWERRAGGEPALGAVA